MSKTFFGIQVVVKNFVSDPLRKQLHEIIARSEAEQSLVEKRAFWKRVTAVLNEGLPAFEDGFWGLIRGSGAGEGVEARASGIEGNLPPEKGEAGAGAREDTRPPPRKRDTDG